MKNILLLAITFSFTASLHGQKIYTKDGIFLGDKSEFVEACTAGASDINLNGIQVDMHSYCSCVCDALIPELYSSEIEVAMMNDDFMSLFSSDQNLGIMFDCIYKYVEVEDEYKFNQIKEYDEYSEEEMNFAIKSCVFEMEQDSESNEIFTKDMMYSYCNCALEKLIINGYSMGQLNLIENENSEVFNEILVPCIEELFLDFEHLEQQLSEESEIKVNSYNPNDISGYRTFSDIDLLSNNIDYGYKIKLNINGVIRYFTLDTGASELFINSDLERELLLEGVINRNDYIESIDVVLADNNQVTCRGLVLDNIKIGDYEVDNTVVYVIDGGSILCGLGLFEKFRKWELYTERDILRIYK